MRSHGLVHETRRGPGGRGPRWRTLLALGIATTVLTASVPPAGAAEVLDQSQLTSTGAAYSPTIAQTFRAGVAGDLTRVRLYLTRVFPTVGPFQIEIRAVDSSGTPTGTRAAGSGTVLASETISTDAVTSFDEPLDLSEGVDVVFASPASIAAGTTYAIVMVQDGTTVFWFQYAEGGTGGPYANGQRYATTGFAPETPFTAFPVSDSAFETYVTPPADATLLDLVAALGLAADGRPDDAWRSLGNDNAFQNRVDGIGASVEEGDLAGALAAADNLRRRIDGCGSAADSNDWIVDCTDQTVVRARLDLLIAALQP